MGTDICFLQGFHLKAVTAKHFALPALDDLFWGEDAYSRGNPELIPEYGWNNEAGILYKTGNELIQVTHEISVFRNKVHDLIIWLPGEEGKWIPENVNESISRGLEFRGHIKREFTNSSLNLQYIYSYTRALIWREGMPEQSGTIRIYVPEHVASVSAGYRIRNFEIRYLQSFTGKRYYDTHHTLDPYTLGDLFLNYNLKCNNICLTTYLKILNLYNTSYQAIRGYAQTPRSYALGINFSFK